MEEINQLFITSSMLLLNFDQPLHINNGFCSTEALDRRYYVSLCGWYVIMHINSNIRILLSLHN
jgi:hypothetical protein